MTKLTDPPRSSNLFPSARCQSTEPCEWAVIYWKKVAPCTQYTHVLVNFNLESVPNEYVYSTHDMIDLLFAVYMEMFIVQFEHTPFITKYGCHNRCGPNKLKSFKSGMNCGYLIRPISIFSFSLFFRSWNSDGIRINYFKLLKLNMEMIWANMSRFVVDGRGNAEERQREMNSHVCIHSKSNWAWTWQRRRGSGSKKMANSALWFAVSLMFKFIYLRFCWMIPRPKFILPQNV